MENKKNIVGCLLMLVALIAVGIILFIIDWKLGGCYLSYLCYRIGYWIVSKPIKINLH